MNTKERAAAIIKLAGGAENIKNIFHCSSRLRLELKNISIAVTDEIKKIDGIKGVIFQNSQLQIIIGLYVAEYYNETLKLLNPEPQFLHTEIIANPASGRIFPLSKVDDIAFSSGIMGKGYAVDPSEGKIVAPFDGIVNICQGRSAEFISETGVDLFVTVGTKDQAERNDFRHCFSDGSRVKKGECVLKFDLHKLKIGRVDTLTPIVVLNSDEYRTVTVKNADSASFMDELILLTK